jgi:hypothetical protein
MTGSDGATHSQLIALAKLVVPYGGREPKNADPNPALVGPRRLVLRTVTASVPVRVDYALTPLGRGLQVEVSHLKRWAEQHMREIIEARRRYDASEPALLKTAAGA